MTDMNIMNNVFVGIIFARYDLQHVQRELLRENYLYWNYNTKRYLDIFWVMRIFMPE